MPYSITDKNPDCSGWAVVDSANKVFGCHTTKASAIKQAVAISLATNEPFVGERKADGQPIIICDIDGTLLASGNRLIQKTWDYVQSLDGELFIVTGRPSSERDATASDLHNAGVAYSRLIMNPGSSADSVDYKKATAEELLKTYKVVKAVENNPDALRAYRSLGIEVMNPADIPATRDASTDAQEWSMLTERQQKQAEDTAELALTYGQFNQGSDANGAHYFADNPFAAEGIKCGNCIFFNEARNQCVVVEGNIDSEAVCKLWVIPESEIMSKDTALTATRALPSELNAGDFVAWLVETESYAGQVVSVDGATTIVRIWEEDDECDCWEMGDLDVVVATEALQVIEPLQPMPENLDPMTADLGGSTIIPTRDKWIRAAWKIKAKLEGHEERALGKGEIRTNHIELRAEGDGRTFTGYAAVFGQPSLPLPFTEIVQPGAFKRSLQSRNRMMLLWNHDTSNPLASTRNGSLQMVEDARGLKVTATLPDTTLGRDIAELVRTGVVDAMSFGFSVKKDSWSQDGNTRYLEDVSLYEVSLVSTPAYEQTSGTVSVRSADGLSADALAVALQKLEEGEELDASQSEMMKDVIERLSGKVEEPEGDITALYKKKLVLAEMGN